MLNNKQFYVRVVHSNRSTYWYADKIGERFLVRCTRGGDNYELINKPSWFIDIQDAEEDEMMNETLSSYLIITSNNPKTGERQYLGSERAIGGCKYWSGWWESAIKFKTLDDIEDNPCRGQDDLVHKRTLFVSRINLVIAEVIPINEISRSIKQRKIAAWKIEIDALQAQINNIQ